MLPSKTAAKLLLIAGFAALFIRAAEANDRLNMMSEPAIIAFLSQSLGGDSSVAEIAWKGMDAEGKRKVRESASRILKISEKAGNKFDLEIQYQVEWFRASLIAELYANEKLNKADLSERALREFYENNKTLYDSGAKVRFRQIVCASERDAKQVMNILSHSMVDFGAVATDVSLDNFSARTKGEVGWIPKDKIDPLFAEKLFEAELNRIQPPLKVGDKWVIFEVQERENANFSTFEQLRDIIKADLMNSLIQ